MESHSVTKLLESAGLLAPPVKQGAASKFPLKYLIILYLRAAPRDVYTGNLCGFKLLKDWLAPIDIPEDTPETNKVMPRLFSSYELSNIAKIVGCPEYVIFNVMMELIKEGNKDISWTRE